MRLLNLSNLNRVYVFYLTSSIQFITQLQKLTVHTTAAEQEMVGSKTPTRKENTSPAAQI